MNDPAHDNASLVRPRRRRFSLLAADPLMAKSGRRNPDGVAVRPRWDLGGTLMGSQWDLVGTWLIGISVGPRWELGGVSVGHRWDLVRTSVASR